MVCSTPDLNGKKLPGTSQVPVLAEAAIKSAHQRR